MCYWFEMIIKSVSVEAHILTVSCNISAGNYMFKVNNRNTRTRCEICSKLTIKILLTFEQVNAGWVITMRINTSFTLFAIKIIFYFHNTVLHVCLVF